MIWEAMADTIKEIEGQHKSTSIDSSISHIENNAPLEVIVTADLPTKLADDVSYGPGGVRGLIGSPYVFGAAFLASLGGFSFGYDQGVISVINVMDQFLTKFPLINNGFYKGLMTAMLELGAFLGCFFMPWLADKISRRWALSVVVIIFNIGAIIQCAAQDYVTLVIGRTIGGIGVGTLAMGAPIYISEISPPNLRGTLLVLESVSLVSGVVIAYWITYATRYMEGEISFRLPFGLQMICATVLGVCIHFFPYSPRWLAMVDRPDDCLASLSRLRQLPPDDSRVRTEFEGIMSEIEFQKVVHERHHPGVQGFKLELVQWLDLFKKKSWRRTAVGVGVAFLQQFSGVNAFIYYAPTLFTSLGQSSSMSLVLSGILNVLQLIAVVVCFFVIDHIGRRPLAILGGLGMAIPYIVIAVLVALYSSDWPAHMGAGWACVAMAFLYMLIFGVSYSPLTWALPSEVFPTATRSKGVALSTATVWLANFIIGVATPPMLEDAGYGTYIFFAAFCILAGVWAWFLVPETKGKTLEQMDEAFGDTSGTEEKEIMKAVAAAARGQHGSKSLQV
ncbi:putative high-affinity glucose [Phaeomoniella chlamydospora]|uniref:Putative high-affinity glucose n=1 Tax=Phaeomoniella chlamydospora TaxID=158046 RepID=A0A0G2EYV4_PHACM|nr:putative high-affinity glucose [Phaeomoniella chlamydospora]